MNGVVKIVYVKKGSIYEYINSYLTKSFEVLKLHYFEVPVMLEYSGKINKRNWYISSGLVYGKLVSLNISKDELISRGFNANADEFKEDDFSILIAVHREMSNKHRIKAGIAVERSLLSVHEYYKIYNFIYGIELLYSFRNRD